MPRMKTSMVEQPPSTHWKFLQVLLTKDMTHPTNQYGSSIWIELWTFIIYVRVWMMLMLELRYGIGSLNNSLAYIGSSVEIWIM